MVSKVALFYIFACLYGVFGLPSHLKQGLKPLLFLDKWVTFRDTRGDLVLVNVYPEEGEFTDANILDPEYVEFYLFTEADSNSFLRVYPNDSKGLLAAGFDPSLKTKILVHGFLNDVNSPFIQDIKRNLLKGCEESFNVLAVDWSRYTATYTKVNQKAKELGGIIADFIDFIVDMGVSLDDIHCIGHSLGAHACGFAGKAVKSGKISRITGLDPALPGINITEPTERIDATDAVFVDCIHTCAGLLGVDIPICTADFYPNSGRSQPGCHWFDFGSCSHGRSHDLYAESILKGHLFPSASCNSTDFKNCVYDGALMGYPSSTGLSGIYFTTTHNTYPFSPNVTKEEEI